MKDNSWLKTLIRHHFLCVSFFVMLIFINPEAYGDSVGYAFIGSSILNLLSFTFNFSILYVLKNKILIGNFNVKIIIIGFLIVLITQELSSMLLISSPIISVCKLISTRKYSFELYSNISLLCSCILSYWISVGIILLGPVGGKLGRVPNGAFGKE